MTEKFPQPEEDKQQEEPSFMDQLFLRKFQGSEEEAREQFSKELEKILSDKEIMADEWLVRECADILGVEIPENVDKRMKIDKIIVYINTGEYDLAKHYIDRGGFSLDTLGLEFRKALELEIKSVHYEKAEEIKDVFGLSDAYFNRIMKEKEEEDAEDEGLMNAWVDDGTLERRASLSRPEPYDTTEPGEEDDNDQ